MTRRRILVADLLCGAGGSSTGCRHALDELGLDMELVCVNHWPVAIETHQRNHPEARHYIEDIATVRPHILVPEGYLDLLMASPTCTHHSVARGGKPTSDQQRADPWHIITWFTELRVKRAIIENVWEFIKWGPVDPRTMRPIKSREGEYFRAWVDTIRRLGATAIEYRKLNAADYGDATTRQRFIMMIRFDHRRLIWPAATHGHNVPGLKPWRPARDIIDWSLKGKSIFTRKKPLAPKTLARIYAGAIKEQWPVPFLVVLRNHMASQGLDRPLPTIAANGTHIGLATPVVLSQHNSGAARSVDEPIPTITTGGAGVKARPGCARPAVVEPFILNRHGDNGATRAHALNEPTSTATGRGAGYLIEPFILSRHSCGAPRSINEPTPTQVAKHSHVLIAPYYGSGSGETCSSDAEPLPTITAKPRFGMVVPVTHTKGSNRARSDAYPLPTLTTAKGGEYALVMPVTHAGGHDRVMNPSDTPLPTVTGANRGELALIEGGYDYDIMFRMLEPHELSAAMGLEGYNFAGTKTEQVKQIGNAVARRMMQACVRAIMADAIPRQTINPLALAAE